MENHDRRLSVCKASSSKISKPSNSSAFRPPSAHPPSSSRPPPTVVSADLNNFRRVVQQLTGTPPPSASSSPVRESSTRSSRLQRIAPPSLRPFLRRHDRCNLRPPPQCEQGRCSIEGGMAQIEEESSLPFLDQPHHRFTAQRNMQCVLDDNASVPQHDFSWLSSVELFSPPLPYTPLAGRARPAAMVPSSSAIHGVPLLPPPLSNGHPLLSPSTSHAHPRQLLPSPTGFGPASLLPSPSTYRQSLLGPFPQGEPLLLSPHTALPSLLPLPVSPSTNLFNPWLSPWPPSPFLPLPFSPGLFPPSPGLGSFISSPRGFSFYGTSHDNHSKLP